MIVSIIILIIAIVIAAVLFASMPNPTGCTGRCNQGRKCDCQNNKWSK
jgi:hypothetical protein